MKKQVIALLLALMLTTLCAVPAMADGSGQTIRYSNGDVYVGDVVNDLPNGSGTYTLPSGQTYHGDFADGYFNGQGVYKWDDGSWYAGNFTKDLFEGKGIYHWSTGEFYAGDFTQDERTGMGTFIWPNGDLYVGEFVNGVISGRGVCYYVDGSCYIGEFAEGKYNGQGTFIAADGTIVTGLYENGSLVEAAQDTVTETIAPTAEPQAEGFERVEIKGYSIAIPTGYISEKVEDDGSFYYYYYSNSNDFIMIMPFSVASFDDWMLDPMFLPIVYEMCYDSVSEAAGSTEDASYADITINGTPAGYGKCTAYGVKLDYVLYYAPGLDDMMVICYTNATGLHTGDEILQVVIDNTCPAGQISGAAATETAAATSAPTATPAPTAAPAPLAQAGDIITFGRYEQDNDAGNGQEPVRWLVLTVDGTKALVVTEKALLGRPYHDTLEPVTWETCSLRAWMRSDMLTDMFYDEEQVAILPSRDGDPNITGVGNNDLLFLLSRTEVETYLNNSSRNIYPTEYAVANGSSQSKLSGLTWWWLRTPGDTASEVLYISNSTLGEQPGNIKSDPVNYVSSAGWSGSVRPAMWIDLTKLPAGAIE